MVSVEQRHLMLEHSFTASEVKQTSGGDPLDVLVRNPAGSGVVMLFYFGDATHEGDTRVTLADDVSGVSGGSAANVNNNMIGSGVATEADAQVDPGYTTDGEHQETVFVGNGVESIFDGYWAGLMEGEDLAVRLEDLSGNNNWAAVRLAWLEI